MSTRSVKVMGAALLLTACGASPAVETTFGAPSAPMAAPEAQPAEASTTAVEEDAPEVSVKPENLRDMLPQFESRRESNMELVLTDSGERISARLAPASEPQPGTICLSLLRPEGTLSTCEDDRTAGLLYGVFFNGGKQDSTLVMAVAASVDVEAASTCKLSDGALSSSVKLYGCALGGFSGDLPLTFTSPDGRFKTSLEIPELPEISTPNDG